MPDLGERIGAVKMARQADFLMQQAATNQWSFSQLRQHAATSGAMQEPRMVQYLALLKEREDEEKRQAQTKAQTQSMQSLISDFMPPAQTDPMAAMPAQAAAPQAQMQSPQMQAPLQFDNAGNLLNESGGLIDAPQAPQGMTAPMGPDPLMAAPTDFDPEEEQQRIGRQTQIMALKAIESGLASQTLSPADALTKFDTMVSGYNKDHTEALKLRIEEKKYERELLKAQQAREDKWSEQAADALMRGGTLTGADGQRQAKVGLGQTPEINRIPPKTTDNNNNNSADDYKWRGEGRKLVNELRSQMRSLTLKEDGTSRPPNHPDIKEAYDRAEAQLIPAEIAAMLEEMKFPPEEAFAMAREATSFNFNYVPTQAISLVDTNGRINLANPLAGRTVAEALAQGLPMSAVVQEFKRRFFPGGATLPASPPAVGRPVIGGVAR